MSSMKSAATSKMSAAGGEGGGGGQAVLEGASNVWVILGVIGLLLALVAAGIFVWIRKGGLKDMISSSDDPWK